MSHECHKEDFLGLMKEDVTEIKKDVKSLLKTKNILIGAGIAISAFVSFLFTLILRVII